MHTFGINGVIVVFLLFFFLESDEWIHLGREFECALNCINGYIKKNCIYGMVNKEKIRKKKFFFC